jgi:hypothetical protein
MRRLRHTPLLLAACCLLALLGTSACTEAVKIDLANDQPRLVVDALVRDTLEPATVTLTWTTPWYEQGKAPAATGAVVRLSDGTTEWQLLDAENTGIYRSAAPLQLAVGREYRLTIDIQGQRYEASSFMHPVTPVLGLTARFVPKEEATIFRETGYYVTLFSQEPEEMGNYYYWKVYLDDSLFDGIDEVLFTDDEVVNGNFIVWELPVTIKRPGVVRLEQMSITKGNYEFISAFSTLVQANGNPFAPQPANPPTNLRCVSDPENYAFGYFGAAAVSQASITITP